uniref:Uncharacterized protein n=1 Tax=Oryza rufipogon TaxID=4529 RepID=A0A0E0NX54_ORYRU
MPAALGSLSPIRATSAGHDRHGGLSVASASVLDATVSLYRLLECISVEPGDRTPTRPCNNASPTLAHLRLDNIDKETRRVIGRMCYFFAGSATSCNQQTYKWIRLLGAPHHQVQNQVSHVHVIDSNDTLFAC